jgi:hypothetical protein
MNGATEGFPIELMPPVSDYILHEIKRDSVIPAATRDFVRPPGHIKALVQVINRSGFNWIRKGSDLHSLHLLGRLESAILITTYLQWIDINR